MSALLWKALEHIHIIHTHTHTHIYIYIYIYASFFQFNAHIFVIRYNRETRETTWDKPNRYTVHASLYDEALGVLDKVVSSSSNSPASSITQEASFGTDRLESSTQKSKEDES